ncbi:hypothetical protein H4582DRAFT_2071627 [Lactarius indigo]|nr:hypothetical protein H4582DRAFT_2071627 [Lactarius indigo]
MTSFSSRTSAPSLDKDQTAMWSLSTGCVQPGSGFTFNRKPVSQQQHGTSHAFPNVTATGFGCSSDVDWDPAAALWGASEDVLGAVTNDLIRPHLDFASWITPKPPLTDTSSAMSPWSTSIIPAGIVPFPLNQASVTYRDPVPPRSRGLAVPSPSQGDPTPILVPNLFAGTGSSYLASRESAQGHLVPSYTGVSSEYDYTDNENIFRTYYPGQCGPTGPFGLDFTTVEDVETGLSLMPALTSDITLGKRSRTKGTDETVGLEGEGHDLRRKKKGKRLSKSQGILEVEGPSSKDQHKSATRDPKKGINHISKAMRRGARVHAATSAQGLYDRFLPGPSVQQELAEAITQELTWVEECVQGEEPRRMEGTGQQQDHVVRNGAWMEEGGLLFPIPKSLRERYSKLLIATGADLERGAVNELRCRLCPRARFSAWEGFKRHCDTIRVHPWDIYICDHCGDYFGRSDSFMRHRRRRPQVCQKAVSERAEAKGRDIKRLHEDFKARMVRCLDDGGNIGVPFFAMVKAKYLSASKEVAENAPSEHN